jgi:coenzyme F420-reducing hydrogenase alpha subunit
VLNLYFLAAPDYFGYESIVPMARENPEFVSRALRLKKIGNDLTELIGGRSVHPISAVVGGFTSIPSKESLHAIRKRLMEAKKEVLRDVELFAGLNLLTFERICEHVALRNEHEYAINEGRLVSTEGLDIGEEGYRKFMVEKQVSYSTAKHSYIKAKRPFMSGPLPRVNLNFDKLSYDTRKAANTIGFNPPVFKPFFSIIARTLEVLNAIDESIQIIDRLPLREEDLSFEIGAGTGAAITEAPRGILYHCYEFDKEGKVKKADIVTPTAHWARNVEEDLAMLVPSLLNQGREAATLKCEMLVRAYDPCISCATHRVRLEVKSRMENQKLLKTNTK